MSCPDLICYRPEKSVPPKKSWRSHRRTSAEGQSVTPTLEHTDSGENSLVNMRSNTRESNTQNDNQGGSEPLSPAGNSHEDMPLDFSVKPNTRRCLPRDAPTSSHQGQSAEVNSYKYPFGAPYGEQEVFIFNGGPKSQTSGDIDHQHASSSRKSVYEPMETAISPQSDKRTLFSMNKSEEPHNLDLRSSTRRGINPSHSPRSRSPNNSSKSPILAGMLTRGSSEILPVTPFDILNSKLIALNLQNGYPNGHNSMCLPAGIQNPHSMMTNPAIFSPSNIMPTPGMSLMQTQMNMFPPISSFPPQGKVENKVSRKVKQERPFKNYDVSLQDELSWPLQFTPNGSRSNVPSPPLDVHSGSNIDPQQNGTNIMNGYSNSSTNSDPPSAASEIDNIPHSSVTNISPPGETIEMAKARGRKRKAVADSEKDASYWERRKKNNQAAKRSRENRRIKEDTVAQQALYFRTEVARISQLLLHLNGRIHDISMKCASLEQDKLNLTAENAMFKQLVTQKRCGQCGNQLSDKLL